MSKTKVLFFIESLAAGGAERVLVDLVENIDLNRFDITVCSVVNTGVYMDRVANRVSYKYLIRNSCSLFGRFIYKLIYRILTPRLVYLFFVPHGFDIEVAFVEGFSTRIIGASRCRRKIAWVHSDFSLDHWTRTVFKSVAEEESMYSKYNNIVCVSDSVRSSLLENYPTLQNTVVIHNPVNESYIKALAEEHCVIPQFLNGEKKIITVGRLVRQKGHDLLLRVAKRLHDSGYSFVINIVGEGPERRRLEMFINENGMESYIGLTGFQDNPYFLMKKSDLYVCSSAAEGFGLVIVEAMLLHLPVITTKCGGADEITNNGLFGVLIDSCEKAIYNALSSYLSGELVFDEEYLAKAESRALDFSVNEFINRVNQLLS